MAMLGMGWLASGEDLGGKLRVEIRSNLGKIIAILFNRDND